MVHIRIDLIPRMSANRPARDPERWHAPLMASDTLDSLTVELTDRHYFLGWIRVFASLPIRLTWLRRGVHA